MNACERCLRRSGLLAALAGRIRIAAQRRVPLPELLALDDRSLARGLGLDRPPAVDVDSLRHDARVAGLTHVCRHDRCFPERLADAPDCCAALFCAGDPQALVAHAREPSAAIVGSRRATAYGLGVARSLARELSACNVPVISGMAFGVDAAAHEGALDAAGPTTAVLACGADLAYPKGNSNLYQRIVRSGVVVSEFPPGFRPERWCFPARNRIMAGLASMTIVVEGRSDSGSLITAGFAADLGRDVGAVPGPISSQYSCGPNDLLADGACVVRGAGDVLDTMFGPGAAERWAASRSDPPANLDPCLRELLEAVERGERSVEDIAAGREAIAPTVAGLGELELLGLIRRDATGRYVRAG